MHPVAVVHHRPKLITIEAAQIGDDGHGDLLDALVVQCPRQMVMIDDVMPALGPLDHRDHVFAEELSALFRPGLAPALALGKNLPHADGDLCWSEIGDLDRRQYRLAYIGH